MLIQDDQQLGNHAKNLKNHKIRNSEFNKYGYSPEITVFIRAWNQECIFYDRMILLFPKILRLHVSQETDL